MSGTAEELAGPDFTQGIELADVPENGMVRGHAHGQAVLVIRHAGGLSAVGATCTHYGGPLSEGLLTGSQLRCPWHHACFNLGTGEAECPPALNPLSRWQVEQRGSRVFVGRQLGPPHNGTPALRRRVW